MDRSVFSPPPEQRHSSNYFFASSKECSREPFLAFLPIAANLSPICGSQVVIASGGRPQMQQLLWALNSIRKEKEIFCLSTTTTFCHCDICVGSITMGFWRKGLRSDDSSGD